MSTIRPSAQARNWQTEEERYALEIRAEVLNTLAIGRVVRQGESDRLEVGAGGGADEVIGAETLEVGGQLTERAEWSATTMVTRIKTKVQGHLDVEGANDTMILAGAMLDTQAGGVFVAAGMSDDLVAGGGVRITAMADLWMNGLTGLEEKVGTAASDGAFVEAYAVAIEREYSTGVHNAGAAMFSGTVHTTMASGFRPMVEAMMGVRNLTPGGGGGGGGGGGAPAPPPAPAGGEAVGGMLASGAVAGRAGAQTGSTEDMAGLARMAEQASEVGQHLDETGTVPRSSDTADVLGNVRQSVSQVGDEAGDANKANKQQVVDPRVMNAADLATWRSDNAADDWLEILNAAEPVNPNLVADSEDARHAGDAVELPGFLHAEQVDGIQNLDVYGEAPLAKVGDVADLADPEVPPQAYDFGAEWEQFHADGKESRMDNMSSYAQYTYGKRDINYAAKDLFFLNEDLLKASGLSVEQITEMDAVPLRQKFVEMMNAADAGADAGTHTPQYLAMQSDLARFDAYVQYRFQTTADKMAQFRGFSKVPFPKGVNKNKVIQKLQQNLDELQGAFENYMMYGQADDSAKVIDRKVNAYNKTMSSYALAIKAANDGYNPYFTLLEELETLKAAHGIDPDDFHMIEKTLAVGTEILAEGGWYPPPPSSSPFGPLPPVSQTDVVGVARPFSPPSSVDFNFDQAWKKMDMDFATYQANHNSQAYRQKVIVFEELDDLTRNLFTEDVRKKLKLSSKKLSGMSTQAARKKLIEAMEAFKKSGDTEKYLQLRVGLDALDNYAYEAMRKAYMEVNRLEGLSDVKLADSVRGNYFHSTDGVTWKPLPANVLEDTASGEDIAETLKISEDGLVVGAENPDDFASNDIYVISNFDVSKMDAPDYYEEKARDILGDILANIESKLDAASADSQKLSDVNLSDVNIDIKIGQIDVEEVASLSDLRRPGDAPPSHLEGLTDIDGTVGKPGSIENQPVPDAAHHLDSDQHKLVYAEDLEQRPGTGWHTPVSGVGDARPQLDLADGLSTWVDGSIPTGAIDVDGTGLVDETGLASETVRLQGDVGYSAIGDHRSEKINGWYEDSFGKFSDDPSGLEPPPKAGSENDLSGIIDGIPGRLEGDTGPPSGGAGSPVTTQLDAPPQFTDNNLLEGSGAQYYESTAGSVDSSVAGSSNYVPANDFATLPRVGDEGSDLTATGKIEGIDPVILDEVEPVATSVSETNVALVTPVDDVLFSSSKRKPVPGKLDTQSLGDGALHVDMVIDGVEPGTGNAKVITDAMTSRADDVHFLATKSKRQKVREFFRRSKNKVAAPTSQLGGTYGVSQSMNSNSWHAGVIADSDTLLYTGSGDLTSKFKYNAFRYLTKEGDEEYLWVKAGFLP